MTTAQRQALGGMNLSSDEEKLEELKAIQAKIKAEEARIKANIAEKKAAEANAQADAQLIAQARGLTGDRDGDGKLIPALDEVMNTGGRGISEIPAAPDKGIATEREDFTEAGKRQESERAIADEDYEAELEKVNKKFGVEGDGDAQKDLDAFELQDYYQHKIEVLINANVRDKIIADKQDIDEDFYEDVESETRDVESNVEQDRGQASYPDDETGRGEKAGWSMEEGSNTWSVNEKDDYWKTQEGFDEAMNLYGQKPSWLKETTLVYNPETDEYEEIEEEEFEDLSRPAVSAEVKKLFG